VCRCEFTVGVFSHSFFGFSTAEHSDSTYASIASEVARLQSVFVTSVLSHIEADRTLSSTRAMWQRALILLQDHPRIAGWTQTQLWYRAKLWFSLPYGCWSSSSSHLSPPD
jgi:hypothetical protein